QRAYNALNTIGLATGIACGLIIAMFIKQELSYDRSFAKSDLIYRAHINGWAKSSPPLAALMGEYFPEIESVGRFAFSGSHGVSAEGGLPIETSGYFADSTVLKVFGFKLLAGEADQALRIGETVVITESLAKRLFGDDKSAIGKTLDFDGSFQLTVNAVMEDVPENSHLKFDYLFPIKAQSWGDNRGWMVMYTYAKFKSAEASEKAHDRMPGFIRSYYQGEPNVEKLVTEPAIRLQPLTDIHLKSANEQEMGPNGSLMNVYIFIAVEALILIIACANFMSLFTTQAIRRVKEVGMRKVLGAKPTQLMVQFFVEVVMLAFISLFLAIILYQVVLPYYNNLAGASLQPWQIFQSDNLLIMFSILAVIILSSGLYPAIFIARFKAGSFLREQGMARSFPNVVRAGLVVFQFSISAILIASTIIVHQQMGLLQDKQLGFDKDQVVFVRLYGKLYNKFMKDRQLFKNELVRDADVISVGSVSGLIGDDLSVESVVPQGKESEMFPSVRLQRVDEGYLEVLHVDFISGRNFSNQFNDSASYILNEAAVKALRIENPIGQVVVNTSTGNKAGKIVGVVRDFHFASLRTKIEPLVIEYKPEWTGSLALKLKGGNIPQSMKKIEATIEKVAPNSLFVYSFLDDKLDALYRDEQNLANVFQFFAALAIIIACLGLISLCAYTVERRTKEIGVRKVLGANVTSLVTMLSARFLFLVVMAFAVAIPVTTYFMSQWLDHFAYKIDIQWWIFVVTAIIIVAVTAAVVGFHTVRAALINPVRSLRYE
ncbi:MAG: ABC transporter permease, partial [Chryseolinea sp.]